MMDRLKNNVDEIRKHIVNAATKAGRDPAEVTVIAVTKTVKAPLIAMLSELGLQDIGENRIQATQEKQNQLTLPKISWHMIGHLQRNKVKLALPLFDLFHSVDSYRLAEEISQRSSKTTAILLQVNITGESTKYGFSIEELEQQLEKILDLPRLDIRGLMTMAPFTQDTHICRNCFRSLRQLKDRLNQQYKGRIKMHHLSMGMSQDYEVAVEEGATLVRIGSAFFQKITNLE